MRFPTMSPVLPGIAIDVRMNTPINEQIAYTASEYLGHGALLASHIDAERFFSEPLLNRIGEQNIFFFPHLSFLAIRRLAEAKLDAALNSLVETENGRGWNISFASPEDRIAFIDMIESDGFVIREQGASVNGFVKVWIKEALKAELLKRHVSVQKCGSLGSGYLLSPFAPPMH